jgi:hypothetical protein
MDSVDTLTQIRDLDKPETRLSAIEEFITDKIQKYTPELTMVVSGQSYTGGCEANRRE